MNKAKRKRREKITNLMNKNQYAIIIELRRVKNLYKIDKLKSEVQT